MADQIINGSDIFVFMDGEAVAHATSHTLGIKMATRNTSNKDSGVFETKAAGRMDVTASCEAMAVYGDFQKILSAMVLRQPVTLEFGQKDENGDLDTSVFYAHGDFLITSFDQNSPDQGNVTYSASFEHFEGFSFTPDADLNVKIVATGPVSAAIATGTAAVFVTGGIEPYTYDWTDAAGGPTIDNAAAVYGLKAAVAPAGTLVTCVVTDSTPVTPLTGTATIKLVAAGA
jgi:hypothetical protein